MFCNTFIKLLAGYLLMLYRYVVYEIPMVYTKIIFTLDVSSKQLFFHILSLLLPGKPSYSFDVTKTAMHRTKTKMSLVGSAFFILMYFTSPIQAAGGDCTCKCQVHTSLLNLSVIDRQIVMDIGHTLAYF